MSAPAILQEQPDFSLVLGGPLFQIFRRAHLFGSQNLTFLRDVELHVRFLVALPVLILAELPVHRRLGSVVKCFLERGVVTQEDTPKFYAALEATMRARDSSWLEFGLLVFTLTVGHWFWQHLIALGAATWYAAPDRTDIHLTLAGYWYSFVSIPIFQFILLRWYL